MINNKSMEEKRVIKYWKTMKKKKQKGHKPLLYYSTIVISSIKWPQLPSLSRMKST